MNYTHLIQDIGDIHTRAKAAANRSVDRLLTLRNWLIGAYIVEYEQNGEDRAAYGEELLLKTARTGLPMVRSCSLVWPNHYPRPVPPVWG